MQVVETIVASAVPTECGVTMSMTDARWGSGEVQTSRIQDLSYKAKVQRQSCIRVSDGIPDEESDTTHAAAHTTSVTATCQRAMFATIICKSP
jgi:hypothetical protein